MYLYVYLNYFIILAENTQKYIKILIKQFWAIAWPKMDKIIACGINNSGQSELGLYSASGPNTGGPSLLHSFTQCNHPYYLTFWLQIGRTGLPL